MSESEAPPIAQPGELVAARFRVVERIAAGGMATVFVARDETNGTRVALKILHERNEVAQKRFLREAVVLSQLHHPRIVPYLAHGVDDGLAYLVMDLCEGETLSQRLRRGRLALDDALAVVEHACEALDFIHRAGLVHRDVKPSNLFLVDGQISGLRVLDFGLVRRMVEVDGLTLWGQAVGTPGYMSPEQARGDGRIDARADVFSLGCVLFACLTGRHAFMGQGRLEVLLKIALDRAPRVRSLRRDVPAALDELCARMLAKERGERPPDAGAVRVMLAAITPSAAPEPLPSRPTLYEEVSVASIVVAMPLALPRKAVSEGDPMDETVSDGIAGLAPLALLREQLGASITELAGGLLAATFASGGSAAHLARTAARCAQVMRERMPSYAVALATGRALVQGEHPMGDAIERAVLLARASARKAVRAGGERPPIRTDAVTAALLDAHFTLSENDGAFSLGSEREPDEPARTVLGRATPFVGREAELTALLAELEAVRAGTGARAALVSAAPGTGKSRLVRELVMRARDGGAAIWVARGGPLTAGTPFGVVAQLVRRAAGIHAGEPLAERHRKLAQRVEQVLGGSEARLVTAFLGTMAGASEDEHPALQKTRADPRLFADRLCWAWCAWLGAECSRAPVVLVLEDAHWGDVTSAGYLGAALRTLARAPLWVVGTTRPGASDVLLEPWRGGHTLELAPLDAAPIERLARAVLGERATPELVQWIVAHARGNPLYAEELMRAVDADTPSDVPGALALLMQARLETLPAELRRVLRAASVVGVEFWTGAVAALLDEPERERVDEAIAELGRRELVGAAPGSRFHGEPAYVFRHSLVQEAAYGSLTEEDRRLGHRLAADWLAASGELDGLWLARHYEIAGEPRLAGRWFQRAAERALEGNDLATAFEAAERAIDCGSSAAERGAMRLLQAEVSKWRGDSSELLRVADDARSSLTPGSPGWIRAAVDVAIAGARLGAAEGAVETACEGLAAALVPGAAREVELAAYAMAVQLYKQGTLERARTLLAGMEAFARASDDDALCARVDELRSWDRAVRGDVAGQLTFTMRALGGYERAGDARNACVQRAYFGFACLELGDNERAEQAFRQAIAEAEAMGLAASVAVAQQNLGIALTRRRALDEARGVLSEALATFRRLGNRRMESATAGYLALACLEAERIDEADTASIAAVAAASAPPDECAARAWRALVLLRMARLDDALFEAESARRLLEQLGGIDADEATVRLAYAEVLIARGQSEQAAAALAEARTRLCERAARIADAKLGASFLEHVPENARTLALARALLG